VLLVIRCLRRNVAEAKLGAGQTGG
jgi:hypothetical protein